MRHREESEALLREILGDGYQNLRVENVIYEENILENTSKISATVAPPGDAPPRKVEGKGVGIVDAFFSGLIEQFSGEYSSLKTIRFAGFSVTAMLDNDARRNAVGSDAVGKASLTVENSAGHVFEFIASSVSITAAALQATLDAVEFFINSEMAFMTTHRALEDAKSRGRSDLAQTFGGRLAQLVRNTSYDEALAEQKSDDS